MRTARHTNWAGDVRASRPVVRVYRRGGVDRDELIEFLALSLIANMASSRMARTLSLRIEMRVSTIPFKATGAAFYKRASRASRKNYTVRVARDLRWVKLGEVLAHEICHVIQ